MADAATVVHMGENSPQQVAYKLLKDIMQAEQKSLSSGTLKAGWVTADRAYILKTYETCLNCVTHRNYSIDKM